jgi:hypothetical protein
VCVYLFSWLCLAWRSVITEARKQRGIPPIFLAARAALTMPAPRNLFQICRHAQEVGRDFIPPAGECCETAAQLILKTALILQECEKSALQNSRLFRESPLFAGFVERGKETASWWLLIYIAFQVLTEKTLAYMKTFHKLNNKAL